MALIAIRQFPNILPNMETITGAQIKSHREAKCNRIEDWKELVFLKTGGLTYMIFKHILYVCHSKNNRDQIISQKNSLWCTNHSSCKFTSQAKLDLHLDRQGRTGVSDFTYIVHHWHDIIRSHYKRRGAFSGVAINPFGLFAPRFAPRPTAQNRRWSTTHALGASNWKVVDK